MPELNDFLFAAAIFAIFFVGAAMRWKLLSSPTEENEESKFDLLLAIATVLIAGSLSSIYLISKSSLNDGSAKSDIVIYLPALALLIGGLAVLTYKYFRKHP